MPEAAQVIPQAIPVGLATRLGQLFVAIGTLSTAVTVILKGDHSQETLMLLASTIVTLLTLMGGRYAQAVAAFLNRP